MKHDDGAVEAVLALHRSMEDAAAWVPEDLRQRLAALPQLPGASSRFPSLQDLRHQITFLASAIETGHPEYFTRYVEWYAEYLRQRNLPLQVLRESLSRLEMFYQSRLDPAALAHVVPVLQHGQEIIRQLLEVPAEPEGAPLPADPTDLVTLVETLLAGDAPGALRIASRCEPAQEGYVSVATQLFQPALYRVGDLWQRNRITVADEHVATAASQTALAEMYDQSRPKPQNGRRAVIACVASNHHAVGARVVADAYTLNGWDVDFAGGDVSPARMLARVEDHRPDFVGLSASLPHHIPALRATIMALRGEYGAKCPAIVVGGLATNQISGIWRWTGADDWFQDAEAAIRDGS